MKTHYILSVMLVASVLLGSACKPRVKNEKTSAASESKDEMLRKSYLEDAHRLTLREVNSRKADPNPEGFGIPQDRVNYYLDKLVKISKLFGTNDSIPDLSMIHTFPNPSLQQVLVVLDKDSQFKESFSQKRTVTPDLFMNQILSQNKISIVEYRESAIGPQVVMRSANYLNTADLANTLTQFNGIKIAEAEIPSGDGNDITSGSEGKNAFAIRLSIGEGDCPSGCIHRKFWVFYVNPDNTIYFAGTRGSLPEEGEGKGER